MFDLYLKYVQWKQLVKAYFRYKLDKRKSIIEQIIEDINITFLSGQDVFKIYLLESPNGEPSLLDYNDEKEESLLTKEIDLHLLYYMLVDEATSHYALFRNVYVVSSGKGNKKYLEIYRKNYKQVIDN